jgi:hypothetical protein
MFFLFYESTDGRYNIFIAGGGKKTAPKIAYWDPMLRYDRRAPAGPAIIS